MPNELNRVGLVGTLYHQNTGKNPVSISLRGSINLETTEEVFQRTPPKATTEWGKVSIGWLPSVSILVIRNNEDKGGPTLDLGKKHLDGSLERIPLFIPAGMSTVIYPTEPLFIRCIKGKASYTIFAVPE